MNKLIKTTILSLFAVLCVGLTSVTTPAFAADDSICGNTKISAEIRKSAGCDGGSNKNATNAITNVLNAVIGVLGIVAVIFVVVGGVKYMTSAGDPGKVESAKKTIIYAHRLRSRLRHCQPRRRRH